MLSIQRQWPSDGVEIWLSLAVFAWLDIDVLSICDKPWITVFVLLQLGVMFFTGKRRHRFVSPNFRGTEAHMVTFCEGFLPHRFLPSDGPLAPFVLWRRHTLMDQILWMWSMGPRKDTWCHACVYTESHLRESGKTGDAYYKVLVYKHGSAKLKKITSQSRSRHLSREHVNYHMIQKKRWLEGVKGARVLADSIHSSCISLSSNPSSSKLM